MGSFPGARLLVPALAAALIGAAVLAALAQGGVATSEDSFVALSVTHSDGSGGRSTGTLRCERAGSRAGGYLVRRDADRLCRVARGLGPFLAESEPPMLRPCTQIYGGPQTARVLGRVGAARVDRRFSRTDGCAIADWDRVAELFPAVRSAGS